ncbi:hypothetical protein K3495_g4407 [Podosphaera aphanis]|nr:hypothetical protein K3495_g4407 [Podosphaera aphanis]
MNDEKDTNIDEFPLPPSTPLLASFGDAHRQGSVPEFDSNFRFPNVDTDAHKLDDPERTFKRLRHESDVLAARLAHQLTVLESPTRECSVDHSYGQNGQAKYSPKSKSQLRPITSYSPASPPRFPFKDFAGWDLTREVDETDDTEHSRENIMQPQVAPRLRASSLHCRISPWRKERLEFIFPNHVPHTPQRNTIQHYHQVEDQENLGKEEQEERILRETRKAALAISKAGFNFGFENSESVISNSSTSLKSKCETSNSCKSVGNEKSTTRKTIVKKPSRLFSPADLPLHSSNSPHFAWPLDHGDSGVVINSFPLTPKSAPASVSKFSDLPNIMRQNKHYERKSEISQSSSTLQGEALSAWSPTPEIEKMEQETQKHKFLSEFAKERKKRWGFLGKMKSSIFLRKKSENKPQSFSCVS